MNWGRGCTQFVFEIPANGDCVGTVQRQLFRVMFILCSVGVDDGMRLSAGIGWDGAIEHWLAKAAFILTWMLPLLPYLFSTASFPHGA